MRRIFGKLIIGLVLLLAGLIAYAYVDYFNNRQAWYQKLTVEVSTPDGVRRGSAVTRVTKGTENFVPGHPGGKSYSGFRGEATVVELAPGQYLFALTKEQIHLAQKVFAQDIGLDERPYPEFKAWTTALSELRAKRRVPKKHFPLLVTFRDINKPETVRKVDPANLAATFGPDYSLKSITLEITDEPLTEGRVDSMLGWLGDYYNKHLDGRKIQTIKAENRLANSLAAGDFDTEKN